MLILEKFEYMDYVTLLTQTANYLQLMQRKCRTNGMQYQINCDILKTKLCMSHVKQWK